MELECLPEPLQQKLQPAAVPSMVCDALIHCRSVAQGELQAQGLSAAVPAGTKASKNAKSSEI